MIDYFSATYIFVIGICIGSFLNVCIYRLPSSESIVMPRSKCPFCDTLIPFYDNIPLVSYLILMGRCRFCKKPITFRYFLVELLTGLVALSVYFNFGISVTGIVNFIFIASLIVIIFIDIDHQIIPDVISLPGIIIFFIASFFLPSISVRDSILGILAGGGSLYAVAYGYELIRGKEGMGGGDIKLLAMIGALIGWKGVVFTIYVAALSGLAVGVAVMIQKRTKNLKLAIPFGPFLSIGAITYLYYGDLIIRWYFNLLK